MGRVLLHHAGVIATTRSSFFNMDTSPKPSPAHGSSSFPLTHPSFLLLSIHLQQQFVNDHPGGADLVLQYAGQDATAIMKDHVSHEHSEVAYSMLDDYLIGELDASSASKESASEKVTLTAAGRKKAGAAAVDGKPIFGMGVKKPFLDVTKPLLPQIFFSNFSKEEYLIQVHIPRNAKGTAPIFGNPILDFFTMTPWWVIPLFYIPLCTYFVRIGTTGPNAIPFDAALCWFGSGIILWTMIEYGLHRFLFHLDEYIPDNRVAITAHFLFHGIHHYLPMDRMRLVMPPALGMFLSTPFYLISTRTYLSSECGHVLIAGAYAGFMFYDLIHYYLHHGRPATAHLREMKSYHLDHHYKNAHLGFGITSKLWDYVFNTVLL
ncbi:fatty acid alpha-hydroxylase [Phlyctochytrium planicorne]|nr:fatty acid alpha-hydroxylase [Phlyctochytrium planicorne]